MGYSGMKTGIKDELQKIIAVNNWNDIDFIVPHQI
jgi:hypothetical protein